jgi:PAS domain S-box-containing protein
MGGKAFSEAPDNPRREWGDWALGRRWRKQRQLEELQARLAAIVESSDDAIVSKTLEGIITSWNAGAERIFGYTAEEILGSSILRLIPPDRHHEELEILTRLQCGEPVEQFETIRVRKDGRLIHVSATISPLRDRKGRIVGASKIARDITAHKAMEQRLKDLNEELSRGMVERTAEVRQQERVNALLVESLDEGVVACDASGEILLINRVAREWHGPGMGRMTGQDWASRSHWHQADGRTRLEAEQVPLARALRGERLRNVEISIAVPDKPVRHLLASGGPILDRDNQKCGAVVVLYDITERKQYEQMVQRSQRLESLGNLAAGIAHDLNNALAPVMMSMEMLRARYPAESGLLTNIQKSAQRGAGMVRQLLTFARGEEGTRGHVHIRPLIRELENIMRSTFPKNIRLEFEFSEELPEVWGDATQLHQVLLNLCLNARDAMGSGGILALSAQKIVMDPVFASSLPEASPGIYVVIKVSDTGMGISQEILDRIFEPFFTTKGPEQGTGLGLSTVLGLVKGHGGFINVQSRPGQGSVFTVYLPAEEGSEEEPVPEVPAGCFRGNGETILFVDDELEMREVGAAVLERLNFQVMSARDGVDGLVCTAEHGANLHAIITDLHMPGMDGIQFVRAVRRMLPDVPILVASGRLDERARKELFELDIQCHLAKPFTEGELTEAMGRVLKME